MHQTTKGVKLYMRIPAILFIGCGINVYPLESHADVANFQIEIQERSVLSFGMFSAERQGGNVRVDARSGACQPNGVVMIRNLCQSASFEIRGQPETHVMVEILPSAVNHQGARLSGLSIYPNQGVITLGMDGKAIIYIGGELSVLGNIPMADIGASYMLQVNYLY